MMWSPIEGGPTGRPLRTRALGLLAALPLGFALLPAGTAVADDCANAQFRTGASAGLPDCRAFERVSSQRKFGNGIWPNPPEAGVASGFRVPGWSTADGQRIQFNAVGGAGAENAVRGYQFPQVADRSAGGWSVRPAIDGPPNDRVLTATNALPRLQIPSADRSALMFTGFMQFSPLQTDLVLNSAPGGVHLAGPTGAVSWLSQPAWAGADLPPDAPGLLGTRFAPVGVSEDLSTAYFMTRQTLTPQDGVSGRTWDQAWALYKVKDGVLSNAGTLPDGSVSAAGSASAGLEPSSGQVVSVGSHNLSSTLGAVNVVSPDGERALFVDVGNRDTPSPQLYMHRDGQPSLLISKRPADTDSVAGSTGLVPIWGYSGSGTNFHATPVASAAERPGATVLAAGDRELGVVVFATRDSLRPGAPDDGRVNTYRYDVASNQLDYLADLDRPGIAVSASIDSRHKHGNIYRISDDAERILFWTPAGELKLWRYGLSTLTLATGLETSGDTSTRGARFSEDGRTVVFMSTRPIAGEPNHPAGNGPNQTQVYRFEEGVDLVPRCVSCPPLDAVTRGQSTFDLFTPISTGFGSMQPASEAAEESRGISADGRRVFFTTSSTLDPRDQNAVADVYEWSVDGGVALLSSGSPQSLGEGLLDVDAAGDNVFFVSTEQLTASDIDDIPDLYVARVGGGLPDPPPADDESVCVLGGCQGPVGPAPGPVAVGSDVVFGDQSVSAPVVGVLRARLVRGAAVRMRVRVPGAGRISVAGSKVRRSGRSVSRAGRYSVRVVLKPRARKRLKRRKAVRAAVRVVYRAADGQSATRTVSVKFKRPKSKGANDKKKGGR